MHGGGYYVFTLSWSRCPDICPVRTSAFLSLRTKTQRILMKFGRSSRYHQHMNWLHFGRNCTRDKWDTIENSNRRQLVLPHREWLHKFYSTYGTLRPRGWRVHYTHAAAEVSYGRARSLALQFSFYFDSFSLFNVLSPDEQAVWPLGSANMVCPRPPLTLTFDHLTLKLVCKSHLRLGTFLPNLSTGFWVLELFAMYATDGQTDGQTNGRTKSNAYCPLPCGRGHNKCTISIVTASYVPLLA